MRALVDIETDGLSDATRIWCISVIDIDTEQEYFYGPDELDKFVGLSMGITHYVGHNFLTFDREKLDKFLNIQIPTAMIEDTLILSRLVCSGLMFKHSLEAWGEKLGYPKVVHEDWSQYSPEMKIRCVEDTRLNLLVYKYLKKELVKFSPKCQELEHQVQEILNEQKQNGFHLNIEEVYRLHLQCKDKADAIEAEIHTAFPPHLVLQDTYTPKYNKEGKMFKKSNEIIASYGAHARWLKDGTVELYTLAPFNLGSPKQIIERLDEAGWAPRVKTKAGNPQLCEENLDTLKPTAPPAARKLIEWWMLRNRCTVMEGWLDAYNPITGCIHGTVIGLGAITHRMAHYDPQMANIPAVRNPYGTELRSCLGIGTNPDYVQLGVDISGIQLCILAHYLNDPKYTEAIANGKSKLGTDVHSMNMRILQEVHPPVDRDAAKKFIYSMLFGAGGYKLGLDMGAGAKEGNRAKKLLFARIPAFKRVQKMCEVAVKRGYMIGIDGRRVPVKSEHYALSVYLQCGEAIVMKQALVFTRERAKHLDWKQMAVVHDEVQSRVRKEQAEELASIMINAIIDAGKLFQLRCPLNGNYSIGQNWSETH